MDKNLAWNEHYNKHRCKIEAAALLSLQKLKKILTQYKLDEVFKALFKGHL